MSMKSSVEKVSSLQRRLSVQVPQSIVAGAFDRVFQGIQKQVEIKGFRKGKAPLATIKSMYGDRVAQDVAQDLIQKHYGQALTEHKLDPIGSPEFEFEDPSEAKEFSFTASFDIRPEIQLKKVEGLEVEKERMEFDEAKVTQVLDNIRASRAQLVDVLEDRPAQNGDTAVIDFEGFVNGAPLENGAGQDHNLELGSNSFIAGFEEGILGLKVGAQKTLNLKFPDPYHSKELSGAPVEFKVTLKKLKKKELPELNNEFLATLGGPSDLDGLKKMIREDLEKSEQKRIDDAFKNRLLKKLVKENPVEVPASLLKEQKEVLIEDFRKKMNEQGLPQEEFQTYVSKWNSDFEKTAAEMIQSSFLIDTIARQNDLLCKKEDIDKKFTEYSQQTGIEESRIREFYSKPEQMSRLTYMITEEKVIDHLNKTVKVKEVPGSSLKDESEAP